MVYSLVDAIVVDNSDWYCTDCQVASRTEYEDARTKRCKSCERIMQRKRTIETLKMSGGEEEDANNKSALDW